VLAPGDLLGGKLRIEKILGQGGMGVVAVATHLQLEQRVAVKVLRDQLASGSEHVERFMREARAAARLRSEHVCRVQDVGELDGGGWYIVMELLDGRDLASVGVVPIATAVDYVLQASVGLAEAHTQGIVHRDLKPANLFLTRRLDGTPLVKVLDFGISKAPAARGGAELTGTDTLMGSPGYMSPEQLRSSRGVDARTDVWSLGVILYQLVSGRLPFPGASITETSVKIAMDPPDALDVDPAFAAVVMRCLEKAPEARYADVGALAAALAPFGGPAAAAHVELIGKLLRPAREDAYAATLPPMRTGGEATASTLRGATGVVERPASRVAPKRGRWVVLGIAATSVVAMAAIIGAAIGRSHREPVPIAIVTPQAQPMPMPLPMPPAAQPQPPAASPQPQPHAAPPQPHAASPQPHAASPQPHAASPQPHAAPAAASHDLIPGLTGWLKTANEHMLGGEYTEALALAEGQLAHDPNDHQALRLATAAACYGDDAAKAKKYAKQLDAKTRAELDRYICSNAGIDITTP
jgi:serine/threonine-protein kinase